MATSMAYLIVFCKRNGAVVHTRTIVKYFWRDCHQAGQNSRRSSGVGFLPMSRDVDCLNFFVSCFHTFILLFTTQEMYCSKFPEKMGGSKDKFSF